MPTLEIVEPKEEQVPPEYEVTDVEVKGDEAVIRVNTTEGLEERSVKLPKVTWG